MSPRVKPRISSAISSSPSSSPFRFRSISSGTRITTAGYCRGAPVSAADRGSEDRRDHADEPDHDAAADPEESHAQVSDLRPKRSDLRPKLGPQLADVGVDP